MRKELREAIEKCGWSINEKYGYLESTSPLGEDLIIQCGDDETFKEAIKSEYNHYDADEHAEMWIQNRGKNGTPNSIRELLQDADDIDEMLEELYNAVKEIEE